MNRKDAKDMYSPEHSQWLTPRLAPNGIPKRLERECVSVRRREERGKEESPYNTEGTQIESVANRGKLRNSFNKGKG
jgi:hypothetical protein